MSHIFCLKHINRGLITLKNRNSYIKIRKNVTNFNVIFVIFDNFI